MATTPTTDVVVPKENLVGQLNKGWTIGKRLVGMLQRSDVMRRYRQEMLKSY